MSLTGNISEGEYRAFVTQTIWSCGQRVNARQNAFWKAVNFFTIVAIAIIAFTIYLLFRPNKYEGVNEVQLDSKKAVASK